MRLKAKQTLALFTLGLLVCAGIAGVGPLATPAAAEKILKVGSIGPFTGPAARVGEEFKNSITMAFDEIGWKVGDYKVEFVWVDSESDAEKAAKAYERAIVRDKIDVGFNTWHSWVSASCMEVAAKYKVPHFFSFGAGKLIIEKYQQDPAKYKYWVGKTWPLPEKLSSGYIKALEEAIAEGIWTPKSKRVAVYGVDNDWGRNFGAAVKQQFIDAGWDVVTEEYVQLGETEFYPLLTKIKRADVSVAVGSMSDPPSVAAFIKQSREVGIKAFICSDGLGWVGEWYKLTGDASNYVLDQIPQWTTPKAVAFKENFTKRFGFEPGASSAGLCFDTAHFFIKVLQATNERYGEITSAKLMQCAEELVMTGKLTYTDGIIMREWKYTPETFPDPVVGKENYMFPVIQYFDGQGKIVWPADWREQPIQVPDYMKK